MPQGFPSSVPYASYFVYSPPEARRDPSSSSRKLRDAVKQGRPHILAQAAERIARDVASGWCQNFFAGGTVLVPVPASRPLMDDALWPSYEIVKALLKVELVREARPLLARIKRVKKSAFAPPGERPDVTTHIASMAVQGAEFDFKPPEKILLVDDFITRGATLAAGAFLLRERYPKADVRAFALVRTNSYVSAVPTILEPCTNMIRFNPATGAVDREP